MPGGRGSIVRYGCTRGQRPVSSSGLAIADGDYRTVLIPIAIMVIAVVIPVAVVVVMVVPVVIVVIVIVVEPVSVVVIIVMMVMAADGTQAEHAQGDEGKKELE